MPTASRTAATRAARRRAARACSSAARGSDVEQLAGRDQVGADGLGVELRQAAQLAANRRIEQPRVGAVGDSGLGGSITRRRDRRATIVGRGAAPRVGRSSPAGPRSRAAGRRGTGRPIGSRATTAVARCGRARDDRVGRGATALYGRFAPLAGRPRPVAPAAGRRRCSSRPALGRPVVGRRRRWATRRRATRRRATRRRTTRRRTTGRGRPRRRGLLAARGDRRSSASGRPDRPAPSFDWIARPSRSRRDSRRDRGAEPRASRRDRGPAGAVAARPRRADAGRPDGARAPAATRGAGPSPRAGRPDRLAGRPLPAPDWCRHCVSIPFEDAHPDEYAKSVRAIRLPERPSREVVSGDVLLSHAVARAVPSALRGLASGFGMGPGVSLSLWSPKLY